MAANDLEVACKHSTDMEIKASEAERASIKFNKYICSIERMKYLME